jgi:hypothetical protein
MFLLAWSSEKAQQCAQVLERDFNESVRIVSNLEQAREELKANAFSAVLLDQLLYEAWPTQAEFVFQHLGSAAPVIVNFGISSMDRIVRTVHTSLEQRKREMQIARQQACAALDAELKDSVTALLLSCGLGLQDQPLPANAAEQIRRIQEIAKDMQQKLLGEDVRERTTAAHA